MIRATFWQSAGRWVGFQIEGHAGAGPAGADIVCAAVSAVAQAIAGGLKDVVRARPELERRSGFLRCVLPDRSDGEGAQALLETLFRALVDLHRQYPGRIAVRTVRRREEVHGAPPG
ncbi:MAG TPA: ribosomal-processing cysteine protease Prp [Limnochordia bacterium]